MPPEARHIQNLALTGFMGTGKSSVGRLLADQLRFAFLDTDEEIERRTGKSIPAIFAHDGEAHFRDLERALVAELATLRHTVISTGGGLGANAENIARLKAHALVVCLWAAPNRIWERIRHQHHRPLLQDPDPLGKIRRLLKEREPVYRQADVLLNTELRCQREDAQQILHQFHAAQPRSR